jgi:hypothetical protein
MEYYYCVRNRNMKTTNENETKEMKLWREKLQLKVDIEQKTREVTNLRKALHEKDFPVRGPYFSEILRKQLLREKSFRRPDGTIFKASELEIITARVIKQLRKGRPLDIRLLDVVLNRLEGKPKEHVELTGIDGGAIKYVQELTDEQLETIASRALSSSGGVAEEA